VPAELYFNPACSKCRTATSLLDERGVAYDVVRYLDVPPSLEELRALMDLLGIADPREMMRTGEPLYRSLGLDEATPQRQLEAVVDHPILLERPILVVGGRAVIARPPEKVFELLDRPEALPVDDAP